MKIYILVAALFLMSESCDNNKQSSTLYNEDNDTYSGQEILPEYTRAKPLNHADEKSIYKAILAPVICNFFARTDLNEDTLILRIDYDIDSLGFISNVRALDAKHKIEFPVLSRHNIKTHTFAYDNTQKIIDPKYFHVKYNGFKNCEFQFYP